MGYGVRLRVGGPRACFTRPEMKAERVSYDVITPSAARGILEAIHWKPAIRWVIDRIHVLAPIRFDAIRRNEVGAKMSDARPYLVVEDERQQRTTLFLADVDYLIEAHFDLVRAGADDSEGKHLEMFRRRARAGQCFHQPCLGVREFPARFELCEDDPPRPHPDLTGERDLGWMLHDIDFAAGRQPRFFQAVMRDGVIEVPPFPPTLGVEGAA
ncbi:MAG: type I-C CRISPR-associated protein Cas5c [Alphaproteobacteria bacterium]